jgi:phosphopantetheinyl transferase
MLGKQIVCSTRRLNLPLDEIEIVARGGRGRPTVWIGGVEQSGSISLSHTEQGVLVAASQRDDVLIGVDITPRQPLSDGFRGLWFTDAENDWLNDAAGDERACYLWAAKEAVYKAVNRDEGFDPRQIEVLPHQGCWYRGARLDRLRLRSWTVDGQVAVVASIAQKKRHV